MMNQWYAETYRVGQVSHIEVVVIQRTCGVWQRIKNRQEAVSRPLWRIKGIRGNNSPVVANIKNRQLLSHKRSSKMGYRKIQNLYKDIRILDFKECFALEKIHGTSAHIQFREGEPLRFFSGGAKHETFVELFDEVLLIDAFTLLGCPEVTVYGEAFGGKMQGMRETYGNELDFVAFEVKIGEAWQPVPNASDIVSKLGLDFVHYQLIPATLDAINIERDKPSAMAMDKFGMLTEKMREGVVLRPVMEYRDYRGNRIITKHKRDEFKETKTKREVDPEKLKVLAKADKVAEEWVTPMRLSHVLDKMPEKGEMEHVPLVIKAMQADIKEESEGEVVWSRAVEKAIGKVTVGLYKKSISKI